MKDKHGFKLQWKPPTLDEIRKLEEQSRITKELASRMKI